MYSFLCRYVSCQIVLYHVNDTKRTTLENLTMRHWIMVHTYLKYAVSILWLLTNQIRKNAYQKWLTRLESWLMSKCEGGITTMVLTVSFLGFFETSPNNSFANDYLQLDTKRSWHGCPRRLHKTTSRKFSEKRFIKSVYKVVTLQK